MSFILDALRKSEHDRQRSTGPGISDMRPGAPRSRFPVWAVAIAALLLINIVVVGVLVLRNPDAHTGSRQASTRTATPGPAAPRPESAPAEVTPAPPQVATNVAQAPPPADTPPQASDARTDQPQAAQPFPRPAPVQADPQLHGSPSTAGEEPEIFESLPSLDDVNAQGSRVPELHLDIHVYAARPAERFVFINMHKYREGGQTPEGTVVERITRDGVVLNHHGVRFTIPRQ